MFKTSRPGEFDAALPAPNRPKQPAPRQVIAVGDFNVPATQADFYEGFGRVEEVYDPRELAAIQGARRHHR